MLRTRVRVPGPRHVNPVLGVPIIQMSRRANKARRSILIATFLGATIVGMGIGVLVGYVLGRLRRGEERPRPLPVLAISQDEGAQSVPLPSLGRASVKTDQVPREVAN